MIPAKIGEAARLTSLEFGLSTTRDWLPACAHGERSAGAELTGLAALVRVFPGAKLTIIPKITPTVRLVLGNALQRLIDLIAAGDAAAAASAMDDEYAHEAMTEHACPGCCMPNSGPTFCKTCSTRMKKL